MLDLTVIILTYNEELHIRRCLENVCPIAKKAQKDKYAKMPLFLRAVAYFIYRYIIKGGILDGKEGLCWDFYQGLWYRWLVDKNILKGKKWLKVNGYRLSVNDEQSKTAIREYIKTQWGINI